jgi:hypothetical protein
VPSWAAAGLLVVHLLLGAFGITSSVSVMLMIISSTSALILWDLVQFDQRLAGHMPDSTDMSVEKYHLQSLAAAASAGMILAVVGAYITLQLTFGVVVLLTLMTVGCLVFGVKFILTKER